MDLISQYNSQIAAVIGAIIILTVGRAKVLPLVGNSKRLKWLAFAVTILAGGMLGYGLYPLVRWLVRWVSDLNTFVGSIAGVALLWVGWVAAHMIVALVRDVADGEPDADARRAALWVPTAFPVGYAALAELIANPQSIPSSFAGAAMALITIIYCRKITNSALTGSKGAKVWKWFCVAVCTFAGFVLIPAFAFVDAQLAKWLSGEIMLIVRIAVGCTGLALIVPALIDLLKERNAKGGHTYEPDEYVRTFCMIGIPCLALAGTAAVGLMFLGTSSSLEVMQGAIS